MFNMRLFLLNFSPVLRWEDLPADVRDLFGEPNALLEQAECFVADAGRGRFRFELVEERADGTKRHRADVVILQSWGLLTLVKRAANGGRASRAWVLRPEVIGAGAYAPRAASRGRGRL